MRFAALTLLVTVPAFAAPQVIAARGHWAAL